MQVSVRLAALPIPEYLDFHSGYSAPGSRIAGIYSRIYSYSRIFPNERALNESNAHWALCLKPAICLELYLKIALFTKGRGGGGGGEVDLHIISR